MLSSVSICSLLFILLTPELENFILTSSGCNEQLEGNERTVRGTDLLDQNRVPAGRAGGIPVKHVSLMVPRENGRCGASAGAGTGCSREAAEREQ